MSYNIISTTLVFKTVKPLNVDIDISVYIW